MSVLGFLEVPIRNTAQCLAFEENNVRNCKKTSPRKGRDPQSPHKVQSKPIYRANRALNFYARIYNNHNFFRKPVIIFGVITVDRWSIILYNKTI